MRWLSIEVMLAADPEPALRHADRLWNAARPVGTPHDHRTWLHLQGARDRAYLRRAWRGTRGSPALERWLSEVPPSWEGLAEAYRADRLLYRRPVAEDVCCGRLDRVRDLLWPRRTVLERLGNEAYLHLGAARDAARRLEAAVRLEAHARGEIPAKGLDPLRQWRAESGPLFDLTYGDPEWRILEMLHARSAHRMARLAVLALRHAEERGAPPGSEAAFRIWLGPRAALLDGGHRDLRLCYERPTHDRVRIALDPAGRVPALVRARHAQDLRALSTAGAPPAEDLLAFGERGGGIEIRVPTP